MPDYNAPTISGIVYSFKTGGYSAPTISGVPFQFGLRPSYQQTADLKSVIEASPKYCDTTYTYEKEKQTYVVGYGSAGVQILKGRTIYGGIRDLCTYVYGNPHHADLGAFIRAQIGEDNLGAFIRPTVQDYRDLSATGGGHLPGELGGFIRPTIADVKDLKATIDGTWLHGYKDLGTSIYSIPPKDLQAILNVIEIRDLPASIVGEWLKGYADLGGGFFRAWPTSYGDLGSYIFGPVDLPAYILPLAAKNLPAYIRAFHTYDLGGDISPIPPVDLGAYLAGWATFDLPAYLFGQYSNNDIQAYLNAVPPKDLMAYIKGYKGIEIPFDLQGLIEGWNTSDLSALISINGPIDLGAYIMALGQTADLGARIRPKTILLKKAVYIPLLSHRDLWAVINFQCFQSGYSNLSAYVYPIHKRDLQGYITGWYGNGTADTIRDLGMSIGTEDYITQDRLSVSIFPEVRKYTRLNLTFSTSRYNHRYKTFDKLPLLLVDPLYRNLSAYIRGEYESVDLGAEVYGEWDWNYSQLPDYINPRTQELVIDLDSPTTTGEYITKFVELMFDKIGETPFSYFYVDGTQKIYKIDRSRYWTVWATSYEKVDDDMVERVNYRRKHIFRIQDYNTVDEAIRDLIDRVSTYRRSDLNAYIEGILDTHLDLGASIAANVVYRWNKNLYGSIRAFHTYNLDAYAKTNQRDENNLAASITGI